MQDALWGLPDPDTKAEFYQDVIGKRLFAWLIDSVLIAILTLVAIPFTAFTALFFLPVLWLVIGMAYRIVMIARYSATFGMLVMAIEFRNHRGERLDLPTAIVHTTVYTVSMGIFLLQIISIVLMLTTPRRQSLGDHMLGTAALNRAARV